MEPLNHFNIRDRKVNGELLFQYNTKEIIIYPTLNYTVLKEELEVISSSLQVRVKNAILQAKFEHSEEYVDIVEPTRFCLYTRQQTNKRLVEISLANNLEIIEDDGLHEYLIDTEFIFNPSSKDCFKLFVTTNGPTVYWKFIPSYGNAYDCNISFYYKHGDIVQSVSCSDDNGLWAFIVELGLPEKALKEYFELFTYSWMNL